MKEPLFLPSAGPLPLGEIARLTGAVLAAGADPARLFDKAAGLAQAGPRCISFHIGQEASAMLARTRAGACFVVAEAAGFVPADTLALIAGDPLTAFTHVVAALYPSAARPGSLFATQGISPSAFIHAEARLENGVVVDPGAVIGPRAEIGGGTIVGASSVIGSEVRIGRNCSIGAQVTIACALIGDGVRIAPGVRIGQDASELDGTAPPFPAIGRVIIQDRVDIGANTVIDRGATGDTVIGEASRIGHLVHIPRGQTVGRLAVVSRRP